MDSEVEVEEDYGEDAFEEVTVEDHAVTPELSITSDCKVIEEKESHIEVVVDDYEEVEAAVEDVILSPDRSIVCDADVDIDADIEGDDNTDNSVLNMDLHEFMEKRSAERDSSLNESGAAADESDVKEIPPEMRGLDGVSPSPHQIGAFSFMMDSPVDNTNNEPSLININTSINETTVTDTAYGAISNSVKSKVKKINKKNKSKQENKSLRKQISFDALDNGVLEDLVEQMESVQMRLSSLRLQQKQRAVAQQSVASNIQDTAIPSQSKGK
jgi:hypothetical protein